MFKVMDDIYCLPEFIEELRYLFINLKLQELLFHCHSFKLDFLNCNPLVLRFRLK